EAGTVMVSELQRGAGLGVVVGHTIFFVGNDGIHGAELWKSDGTEAGTQLVKDLNPGPVGSWDFRSNAPFFTNGNGTLYFAAVDHTLEGTQLWKSDGTEAGTVVVADLNPGGASIPPLFPGITAVGSTVYFEGFQPDTGLELWKTDGTAAGTVLV